MASRYFVLILKCTEEPTVPSTVAVPVVGEDTNMYEKIHMYQLNNENSFNKLKEMNAIKNDKKDKNDATNNHAIIFIKLTDNNISNPTEDYQEIKYFKYKDINENFITQIDTKSGTATEMNCYQSTYAIKGITPEPVDTYEGLKLDDNTDTKNILINNGGKIVVTSSKNNDQIILHHVSKMFGFEDIIADLGNSPVNNNEITNGGELAEYQNQKEQQQNQIQNGGKRKKSKNSTKKRNQK